MTEMLRSADGMHWPASGDGPGLDPGGVRCGVWACQQRAWLFGEVVVVVVVVFVVVRVVVVVVVVEVEVVVVAGAVVRVETIAFVS